MFLYDLGKLLLIVNVVEVLAVIHEPRVAHASPLSVVRPVVSSIVRAPLVVVTPHLTPPAILAVVVIAVLVVVLVVVVELGVVVITVGVLVVLFRLGPVRTTDRVGVWLVGCRGGVRLVGADGCGGGGGVRGATAAVGSLGGGEVLLVDGGFGGRELTRLVPVKPVPVVLGIRDESRVLLNLLLLVVVSLIYYCRCRFL
ncbi:hypothetical protein PanWU01x14_317050 [Parasponia andersonii]|uniref:Transmembrane protein n=1 Tax=Parasponia andersonii TaxID=3476 RepID=A0A2P5AMX1_PARAD|nr:hypothetical protein PanWU01x14_317050 [Parasponia andersonii]